MHCILCMVYVRHLRLRLQHRVSEAQRALTETGAGNFERVCDCPGMSARAWWTLIILGAPFVYVLTLPPIYHYGRDFLNHRHGTPVFYTGGTYHDDWESGVGHRLLKACRVPYEALEEVPLIGMPLLGYYTWWGERL
jgi:hypothetical protein